MSDAARRVGDRGTVLIAAPFAAELAARLTGVPAGVRIVAAASSTDFAQVPLDQVTVLATLPQWVNKPLLASMPRLEWLQALTAGIDPLLNVDLSGITLTTMGGAHAPQMSELAFTYLLAFAREFRTTLAHQAACEWRPASPRLLAGAHIVIVGVGRIGEALARRCQAFDMRVTGVSGSRREAPGFDRVVPMEALTQAAGEADYLVVLAPYTPRTHHLISREVIAALPARAVFLNLARGLLVDEAALLEALSARRIAGAGLDVFATEPLPADHPFWRLPNVILTPHVGGLSANLVDQLAPLLADNLARWFGEPKRPLRSVIRDHRESAVPS